MGGLTVIPMIKQTNSLKTYRDVIAQWRFVRDLARDLDEPYDTVQKWKDRDRIPPGYWGSVVNAASIRGYEKITLEALATIAERYR